MLTGLRLPHAPSADLVLAAGGADLPLETGHVRRVALQSDGAVEVRLSRPLQVSGRRVRDSTHDP
jgi:hypothetical protein